MRTSDQLQPDLSRMATVAAFRAGCNLDSERLFVTASWFAPYEERLLAALPTALTEDLVAALRDALYKRRQLETVVDFVEQYPITWDDFARWQETRALAQHLADARVGFFPWRDVEASANDEQLQSQHAAQVHKDAPAWLDMNFVGGNARHCPGCNRAPADLTSIYFSSPPWTWQKLCGRAGWLTICRPCHLQVDFFLTIMN